ncbi:NFX1-type zinc finger-containing protein 1 [Chamberlinius hualienensis]
MNLMIGVELHHINAPIRQYTYVIRNCKYVVCLSSSSKGIVIASLEIHQKKNKEMSNFGRGQYQYREGRVPVRKKTNGLWRSPEKEADTAVDESKKTPRDTTPNEMSRFGRGQYHGRESRVSVGKRMNGDWRSPEKEASRRTTPNAQLPNRPGKTNGKTFKNQTYNKDCSSHTNQQGNANRKRTDKNKRLNERLGKTSNVFKEQHFTIKQEIEALLTMDKLEMLMKLHLNNGGINKIVPKLGKIPGDFIIFLQLIGEVCSLFDQHREYVISVLLKLANSDFPTILSQFLCVDPYRERGNPDWIMFFRHLLRILKTLFIVIPSTATNVFGQVNNASIAALEHLLSKSNFVGYKSLSEKFKEMEKQRIECIETFDSTKQGTQGDLIDAEGLPTDFRNIPINLCEADLNQKDRVSFRPKPNKATGSYQNVNDYLDVQFRLLREDFVAPLRESILEYMLKVETTPLNQLKLENARFYTSVKILGMEHSFHQGILYQLMFDVSNLKHVKWDKSKRLMYGSLICLSTDNFVHFDLATVADSNPGHLKSGLVSVKFLDPNAANMKRKWVMIESPSFYEAYAPVLLSLKKLNEENFSFQSNIVFAKASVKPPSYLNVNSIYLWHFPERKSRFRLVDDESFCPLIDSTWPSADDVRMDESQLKAIKSAITREISLIQGPPGTGKTFVGKKVAELLLENQPSTQILVVCYTNHALDQFLEGILEFCKDIVRIGGQSKSEILTDYNLSKLRRFCASDGNLFKSFEEMIRNETKDIFEELTYYKHLLEISKQVVLTEWTLMSMQVLSEQLWFQLQRAYFYGDAVNFSVIEIWLGIEGYLTAALMAWTKVQQAEVDTEYSVQTEHTFEDVGDILASEEKARRIIDFDDESEMTSASFTQHEMAFFKGLQVNPESVTDEQRHKYQTVLQNLKKVRPMSEDEVSQVSDIWMLSILDKWRLYHYWLNKARQYMDVRIVHLRNECERHGSLWLEFNSDRDYKILSKARVIGMTTTGAAKNQRLLERLQPSVIMVEEAAEVLEAHVMTAINSKCKHLILIGDQQQLRPSASVYELVKHFKFDVSMFERLINNGLPYEKLRIQHRMRPDISSLLVPHIYEDLQDHPSVKDYPNVLGVATNVFFLNHDHKESTISDSRSRSNNYEVEFLCSLCGYLLDQGYMPSQITVLATYLGQVALIKRRLTQYGVYCTAVDNYQGEENDIILLSLVRSNQEGIVGFLKAENRVNVALSRAKIGLFCIGNFNLFYERAKVWKPIIKKLYDAKMIGQSLKVFCQNHPEVVNEIREPKDFKKLPQGGCHLTCGKAFPVCGHICRRKCHIKDIEHEIIECQEPCLKTIVECGHLCQKKCIHNCMPCIVKVNKTLLCGHENIMECSKKPADCKVPVTKTRSCGHEVSVPCHITNIEEYCEPCEVLCLRLLTCGHEQKVSCHINSNTRNDNYNHLIKCRALCERDLPCGHVGIMPCHQSINVFKCMEICNFVRSCGHEDSKTCSSKENPQCGMPCQNILRCGHKCQMKCSEVCNGSKCSERVQLLSSCGHVVHAACSIRKNKNALYKYCKHVCGSKLECGHSCKGNCSKCKQGRMHAKCQDNCFKTLLCGHKCHNKCGYPCFNCQCSCSRGCVHGDCLLKCYQRCQPCQEMCQWKCKHKFCTKLCHELCDRNPCNMPCSEVYPCGHRCVGYCGEPCPNICLTCNEEKFEEVALYRDDCKIGKTFIWLESCGHIIESSIMDDMMNEKAEFSEIYEHSCPKCGRLIKYNYRYGNAIKKRRIDVVMAGTKMVEFNDVVTKSVMNEQQPHLKFSLDRNRINIFEMVLLANKFNLEITVNRLQETFHGLPLYNYFTDEQHQHAIQEIQSLKAFLNSRNLASISDGVWDDVRREIRRLEYLAQILTWSKFKKPSKKIEQIVAILCDTNSAFNESKEDTVKRLNELITAGKLNAIPNIEIKTLVSYRKGDWLKCSSGHIFTKASANESGNLKKLKCPDKECEIDLALKSHLLITDEALKDTDLINLKNGGDIPSEFHDGEQISEIRPDQQLVCYATQSVADFNAIKIDFQNAFSTVIGYYVVVDDIQPHKDIDGNPIPDQCEVFIHMSDSENNILSGDQAIIVVQNNYEELFSTVFAEYEIYQIMKVVNVESNSRKLITSVTSE